jgi:hypothetical protein
MSKKKKKTTNNPNTSTGTAGHIKYRSSLLRLRSILYNTLQLQKYSGNNFFSIFNDFNLET